MQAMEDDQYWFSNNYSCPFWQKFKFLFPTTVTSYNVNGTGNSVISYKTACLCFNAITSSLLISLTFYVCTLLLILFAPVPTPASSKFHSISARQKVIVFSLTLVPLSGTHCHCTLECYSYRHLHVCSKNLSLQPPRFWLAHICLICSV